eukprot:TRINITY_DN2952_c1_g1_i2.p1 TRINITY_DN2952_c1_g1~~TRINITY_DN2952_c1_g1_i2.p1  ORF type:complete len:188 (+),score=-14.32 TRINITY_DN2952_c1_g1_i2:293-856(+)
MIKKSSIIIQQHFFQSEIKQDSTLQSKKKIQKQFRTLYKYLQYKCNTGIIRIQNNTKIRTLKITKIYSNILYSSIELKINKIRQQYQHNTNLQNRWKYEYYYPKKIQVSGNAENNMLPQKRFWDIIIKCQLLQKIVSSNKLQSLTIHKNKSMLYKYIKKITTFQHYTTVLLINIIVTQKKKKPRTQI